MSSPEQEIMALIHECSQALDEKDLARLFAHFTADVALFDVGTQLQGVDAYKNLWETSFTHFGEKVGTERKDVQIHADEHLAFVHCYTRVTGVKSKNQNAKSWLRTTICLKKIQGDWKIVHEHISLPIDFAAMKPAFLLDDEH